MGKYYENIYYFGLAGSLENNSVKENVEVSLLQLDSILRTKGIYSKKQREVLGIDTKSKPVFNNEDYISICIKNPSKCEFEGINEGIDSTYEKYIVNRLSIVLEGSLNLRSGEYERLPGEIQVKDKIGISNFKAIMVGYQNEVLRNVVVEEVYKILEKNNIEIDVIDSEFNIIKNNVSKKM